MGTFYAALLHSRRSSTHHLQRSRSAATCSCGFLSLSLSSPCRDSLAEHHFSYSKYLHSHIRNTLPLAPHTSPGWFHCHWQFLKNQAQSQDNVLYPKPPPKGSNAHCPTPLGSRTRETLAPGSQVRDESKVSSGEVTCTGTSGLSPLNTALAQAYHGNRNTAEMQWTSRKHTTTRHCPY